VTILPNLYICTTILFGICAQMLLLDIRIKNLKNTRLLLFGIGNLLVLATNLILSLVLPLEQYMKIYILFVHVPIFFIFWFTAGIAAIKVIFALFTAVFFIYPANLLVTAISQIAKWLPPAGLYVAYLAVCAVLLLAINRFFKSNFNYLIKNYSGLSFIKLCFLPLGYYIANYWLGIHNFAAVMSTEVITLRLLVFLITLTAYVLILDIAKYAREKEALQGAKMALSLLLESADQQLAALRASQEQAVVYRHDLRHHLALIGGYLADGDLAKATQYVRLAQADIEAITPNRYCENSTVNIILSYFATKAKKRRPIFSGCPTAKNSFYFRNRTLCPAVQRLAVDPLPAMRAIIIPVDWGM
jgi:two-component system sensor histidine kinase AgrC